MQKFSLLVCVILFFGTSLGSDSCASAVSGLKLPVKFKTRGKPPRVHWEQVDKILHRLNEQIQGSDCELTFDQVFTSRKENLYFTLTNNVLRTVPEDSLNDLPVFDQDGEMLGTYEGRVAYERSGGLYAKPSYTLFYFQFRDHHGQLQSSGNRLLLDDFLVKWEQIRDQPAISAK